MSNRTQTSLPCPDWCELPPGHGFHSTSPEDGTLLRSHVLDFGPHVSIFVDECAITDEGPIWREEPPLITVVIEDAIDLEHSRQLVLDLAAATLRLQDLS